MGFQRHLASSAALDLLPEMQFQPLKISLQVLSYLGILEASWIHVPWEKSQEPWLIWKVRRGWEDEGVVVVVNWERRRKMEEKQRRERRGKRGSFFLVFCWLASLVLVAMPPSIQSRVAPMAYACSLFSDSLTPLCLLVYHSSLKVCFFGHNDCLSDKS